MIKNHEIYRPLYTDKEKFIILITGGRGCETPTQEIIMADMTVKMMKDVKVGDKVMGDDGTPRNVLGTMRGRSMMYRVHQSNGEDYLVNDGHILTVRKGIEIRDVNVLDFMRSETMKREYRGYKSTIIDSNSCESELTVEEDGVGDWCGICLDGNQRYLHSDGTVTHNSGKSFSSSTFIERLTFELKKYMEDDEVKKVVHNILYVRYTMTSASISVIPEFMEKVEADGTTKYFRVTKADVVNRLTGAKIMFRGIKTSSGNQTAKLKSIHGITTFVCDEAEEWTSEREFDTIVLSIRQKGIQNRIIIIMNPTDSNHFIYKRYIEHTFKLVDYDGVPVQISTHPDVLHIHTTYLDNLQYLSEQFLKEAENMKVNNPEKYAHVMMGRWSDVAEGAIFKKWGIVDEFPAECKHVAKGLDFGFTNDCSACVRCGVWGNDLYLDELFYQTGMLTKDLAIELKKDKLHIYSESADPRLVQELANTGLIIYPIDKSKLSIIAGIEKIKDFDNIYVTKRSYNLQEELRNYTWAKDKDGNYINEPIDAYNHCFIAGTMVMTPDGEKDIVSLNKDDMVLTSNGARRVTGFFQNGIKKVWHVRLKFKDTEIDLVATPDHRIKTTDGWVSIEDLKEGCHVFVSQSVIGMNIRYSDGKFDGFDSLVNDNEEPFVLSLRGIEVLGEWEATVYDIEVEGMHEFYANGVLVHNCMDAIRYYIMGKILGHILKPKRRPQDVDLPIF